MKKPRPLENTLICKNNQFVDCDQDKCDCSNCGWNPEVVKARMAANEERYKEVL